MSNDECEKKFEYTIHSSESLLERAHDACVDAEASFRGGRFEKSKLRFEEACELFKRASNECKDDPITRSAIELLYKDARRKIKIMSRKKKKEKKKERNIEAKEKKKKKKKPVSPKETKKSKESSKKQVWSAFESFKTLETKLVDLGKSFREIAPIYEDAQPVLGESFMVVPASKTSKSRKPLDSILEETKRANPNELRRRLGLQEKEIRRLLKTIDRLNRENTQLLRDCQSTARVRRENAALRAQMKSFRHCYRNQFAALKRAMEEMKRNMMTEESGKASPRCHNFLPRNRRIGDIDDSLLMMSSAQLDFPFAASTIGNTY